MLRQGIDLNIFITDWERMYDSIPHWLPIAQLEEQGVPSKITRLIHVLITRRM
eukprot:gene3545-3411_t